MLIFIDTSAAAPVWVCVCVCVRALVYAGWPGRVEMRVSEVTKVARCWRLLEREREKEKPSDAVIAVYLSYLQFQRFLCVVAWWLNNSGEEAFITVAVVSVYVK